MNDTIGKHGKRVRSGLEFSRKHLEVLSVVAGEATTDELMIAVHSIARHEGAVEIADLVDAIEADAKEKGEDRNLMEARIGHALLQTLARGADDTWSGRRGDLARSKFDGATGEAKRHVAYF